MTVCCGIPLPEIVASVASSASSRSRWDSGNVVIGHLSAPARTADRRYRDRRSLERGGHPRPVGVGQARASGVAEHVDIEGADAVDVCGPQMHVADPDTRVDRVRGLLDRRNVALGHTRKVSRARARAGLISTDVLDLVRLSSFIAWAR